MPRITPKEKERTRERIVEAARGLFAERGFAATTTRDLAAAAGIASGTLFNYFPTKEALAAELFAGAAANAEAEFRAGRCSGARLEEELFALEAATMRALEPFRSWAREIFDEGFGPFFGDPGSAEAGEARLRGKRLAAVRELFDEHGLEAPGVPGLHLYWTLVLGALAFWAQDESPHREETLALLDRSLRLFVRSLTEEEDD